jgi:hypothetical protein
MQTETTPEAPKDGPVVEYKPRLYKGIDLDKLFGGEEQPEETEAAPEGENPPAPAAAAPVTPKEPPKEEPPSPSLAKGFAQLSKREAQLRAREQEMEAKFKDREAKLAEYQRDMDALLEDPLAVLEKRGITYETLTEQLLNNKKTPADLKQRAEIERLKQAVAAREKADAEREEKRKADEEKARQDAAIATFKAEIVKKATAAGDEYELINKLGKHDLIYDTIDAHFAQTGELLSFEAVAPKVEEHLVEEKLAEAQALLQTKKLSGKLSAVSPAPQRPSGGQSATSGQKPKTLTASTAVAPSSVSHTPLTDEERRAKARAILESGQP